MSTSSSYIARIVEIRGQPLMEITEFLLQDVDDRLSIYITVNSTGRYLLVVGDLVLVSDTGMRSLAEAWRENFDAVRRGVLEAMMLQWLCKERNTEIDSLSEHQIKEIKDSDDFLAMCGIRRVAVDSASFCGQELAAFSAQASRIGVDCATACDQTFISIIKNKSTT